MFINYRLADGSMALVEVDDEVGEYLLQNDRETANADRRERYHAPWHIKAMDYEVRFFPTPSISAAPFTFTGTSSPPCRIKRSALFPRC